MTNRKHIGLGVVAGLVAVGVAVGVAVSAREPAEPRLGGAEAIAGLGDRHLASAEHASELGFERYGDRPVEVLATPSGDLLLVTATALCFDPPRRGGGCHGNLAKIGEDFAVDAWDVVFLPGRVAVAPDGSILNAAGGATELYPSIGDLWPDSGTRFGATYGPVPMGPYSAAFLSDGTLVVADRDEPNVARLVADDEPEINVLSPAGSSEPAPLHLDSPNARLTVVALPDDRVAFSVNAPDDPDHDGQLYLIGGLAVGDGDAEGDGGAEGDGAGGPSMILVDKTTDYPIRRIFPGPEGTLLALDGPRISQVEPDTGETTSVIDLSELTDELGPADVSWPPKDEVSATALGDDLIFTADAKIWRLPDAFA